MPLTDLGPAFFTQPLRGDREPVVNGSAIPIGASLSIEAGESGIVVPTLGGGAVPHQAFENPLTPISRTPRSFEIEVTIVGEEAHFATERMVALARDGQLWAVLDVPHADEWLGDGTTTSFVLSRSLAHGSVANLYANRPPRAFSRASYPDGTASELTVVTTTPGAGEVQVSAATDATSVVAGTAPAAGGSLELRYYPLRRCRLGSVSWDLSTFNEGTCSIELIEWLPERAWS